MDFWIQKNYINFSGQKISICRNFLVPKIHHTLKPQEILFLEGHQECNFPAFLRCVVFQESWYKNPFLISSVIHKRKGLIYRLDLKGYYKNGRIRSALMKISK